MDVLSQPVPAGRLFSRDEDKARLGCDVTNGFVELLPFGKMVRVLQIVVLTVVEIRGDKVRLGIEAPREVPIHRSEVYEAIRRVNESADDAQSEASPA